MSYYILEPDMDKPDAAAIGEVPDSIDPADWYDGAVITEPAQPLTLRLYPNSGDYRGDIMGGLVTLFSEEMLAALKQFGIDSVQAFAVDIEHPATKELEEGYYLVNILGLLECVDTGKSDIVPGPAGGILGLKSFFIDPSRTGGHAMFRLYEKATLIIINESLKRYLEASGLVGLKMRRTEDYDGW